MEIINGICYLKKGDKIKHFKTKEGGLIINVINSLQAEIEFFDEDLILSSREVIPFSVLSEQVYADVQFYKEQKVKKSRLKNKKVFRQIKDEIDLHAEILFPDHYRTMSNENIIIKQLAQFSHYMDSVLDSNIPYITVIHGKGSGSLKSQVIELLEHQYELYNLDTSDPGKTIVWI